MARIYLSVRKVARQTMRLGSFNASSAEGMQGKLHDIKVQASLYVLAMFFCLVPDQIYALIYFLSPGRTYFNFWFETFAYIALPLQGYLNFLVYMRRQRVAYSWIGRIMIAPFGRCVVRRPRAPTDRTPSDQFTSEENAVVDATIEKGKDNAAEQDHAECSDDAKDKRVSFQVVIDVDETKSNAGTGENEIG
ncbi:hypothetical protein ACHAWF_010736 [Thalassiosira exigua]